MLDCIEKLLDLKKVVLMTNMHNYVRNMQ